MGQDNPAAAVPGAPGVPIFARPAAVTHGSAIPYVIRATNGPAAAPAASSGVSATPAAARTRVSVNVAPAPYCSTASPAAISPAMGSGLGIAIVTPQQQFEAALANQGIRFVQAQQGVIPGQAGLGVVAGMGAGAGRITVLRAAEKFGNVAERGLSSIRLVSESVRASAMAASAVPIPPLPLLQDIDMRAVDPSLAIYQLLSELNACQTAMQQPMLTMAGELQTGEFTQACVTSNDRIERQQRLSGLQSRLQLLSTAARNASIALSQITVESVVGVQPPLRIPVAPAAVVAPASLRPIPVLARTPVVAVRTPIPTPTSTASVSALIPQRFIGTAILPTVASAKKATATTSTSTAVAAPTTKTSPIARSTGLVPGYLDRPDRPELEEDEDDDMPPLCYSSSSSDDDKGGGKKKKAEMESSHGRAPNRTATTTTTAATKNVAETDTKKDQAKDKEKEKENENTDVNEKSDQKIDDKADSKKAVRVKQQSKKAHAPSHTSTPPSATAAATASTGNTPAEMAAFFSLLMGMGNQQGEEKEEGAGYGHGQVHTDY